MPHPEPPSTQHLEQAREAVWEAMQLLEEAQRIVFRAGDRYVADVWGPGVRAVIDVSESMAEVSGDLSALHIELGKMVQRAGERSGAARAPPPNGRRAAPAPVPMRCTPTPPSASPSRSWPRPSCAALSPTCDWCSAS